MGGILRAIALAAGASLGLLLAPALLYQLGFDSGLVLGRSARWWYSQPLIVTFSFGLSFLAEQAYREAESFGEAVFLYVLSVTVIAVAAPLGTWALLMALNFV